MLTAYHGARFCPRRWCTIKVIEVEILFEKFTKISKHLNSSWLQNHHRRVLHWQEAQDAGKIMQPKDQCRGARLLEPGLRLCVIYLSVLWTKVPELTYKTAQNSDGWFEDKDIIIYMLLGYILLNEVVEPDCAANRSFISSKAWSDEDLNNLDLSCY